MRYDVLIGFLFNKVEAVMNSNILAAARKGACLVIAMVAGGPINAAVVAPTASVTITKSFAYTSYDGGDFVFSTSAGAPGCASGWWISASDPGFKSAVATVLAAQIAGSYIIVYGDNSLLWSGSPSGEYCRVQTVGLTS
jgi:hypothetical protein